jgi:dihydropteroate synthase
MINDIWGLQEPNDSEHQMARLVADAKIPLIIMHNKIAPGYRYLMKEIITFLSDSIDIACKAGVDFQIIVDPGIGFAKNYQDNLYILQNLDQIKILGRPILLGTSRKSVVGLTLDLPVEQRLEGTIATSIWGIVKGADILRVHDVQAHSRAVKMVDAIKNR